MQSRNRLRILEFIGVQSGIGISDEDFTRLYFEWNNVMNHFQKSKAKGDYVIMENDTVPSPSFCFNPKKLTLVRREFYVY